MHKNNFILFVSILIILAKLNNAKSVLNTLRGNL